MSKMKNLSIALGGLLFAQQVISMGLNVPIKYPDYAREHCIEGLVKFTYVVSQEHKATNIKILSAVPKGIFEAATIENVGHWSVEGEVGSIHESQLTYQLSQNEGCNS